MKAFSRKVVFGGLKERLPGWLSSAQSVELDYVLVQVDDCADEPMGPRVIHCKGSSQQARASVFVGTSQEDLHFLTKCPSSPD